MSSACKIKKCIQGIPSGRGVQAHVCPTICQNIFFALILFRVCTYDLYSRHTKVFNPTTLLPHEIKKKFISWLVFSRVIKLFLISSLISSGMNKEASLFEPQVLSAGSNFGIETTDLVDT